MPLSVFFRSAPEEHRVVEREALTRARGRVLDCGAGVGSMTLLLQKQGMEVTALEVIPEAVEIMGERGVKRVVLGRLEDQPADHAFDTLLLLMNGTALAGTLARLPFFLKTLDGLLAPGGQVLLDSTDLLGGEVGMGVDQPRGGSLQPEGILDPYSGREEGTYPGELHYQLEFHGEKGAPFPQLFVDPRTLATAARASGWRVEVMMEGEEGEYLASLTRGEPGRPSG